MSNAYASMANLRFLLFDVHKAQELSDYPAFEEYNRDTIEMLLETSEQIADKYLFPVFSEMDKQGVHYEKGEVTVPKEVGDFLRAIGEGGWIGTLCSREVGGLQMPILLNMSMKFLWEAANNAITGYAHLTGGAARLIDSFGSEELKSTYLPKMLSGDWQGTMALTEPQAGSALSYIETSAQPQPDGTYRIKGQKIFISGGDHDQVGNVIHLMLARIEGAPQGTKGISLFVVPKHRLEEGSLASNDVTTAGVFHKMGQSAYATTHLIMGEKDDCYGYLVGAPHNGLAYMFQMMNEARIGVGLSATGTATAAYYAALQYCKERPQGRRLEEKDRTGGQTLIINHPDVRRMLFQQKAFVEGSLSLLMECARYADLVDVSEGQAKQHYYLLLELLTPVVKAYASEAGITSISAGVQCLGGYGYCTDFPLQQYYRDIRIMAIYEGTTGIQSQDLLGRKVTAENGLALQLFFGELEQAIAKASQDERLSKAAEQLSDSQGELMSVTQHLIGYALKGQIELFLADATLYMELFGLVAVGWQWLKQGTEAAAQLAAQNETNDSTFLKSKIKTMEFFFAYELTKVQGLATRLKEEYPITIKEEEEYLI
ncbi:MAG: acyl-CoA dehydrogenase [Bacteroidota bacterium]